MERIVYRKTLDVHKNGVQFTLQGFETADKMSRRIEISLMASGDTIDIPLEQIKAIMYVTTPKATEPSINECIIKDNKIIYDVLPIIEEGITEMQLKLIETRPDGANRVLAAPKFVVEVSKSNTDDESVKQTATYTALEDAVAKAKGVYDARLLRMEIDSDCTFRVFYADGTTYETDVLKETLLKGEALFSQSYARGGTGIRHGEDTDNSMYYSNVSRSASKEAERVGEEATELLEEVTKHGVYTAFSVNFETGECEYISPSYSFDINKETGELDAIGEAYTPDENIKHLVNEWLVTQNTETEILKSAVEFQGEQISSMQSAISEQNETISDLRNMYNAFDMSIEAVANNAKERMNSIEESVQTNSTNIGNLQTQVNDIAYCNIVRDGDIGDLKTHNESQDSEIASLKQGLTATAQQVNTNASDIKELQSEVATIDAKFIITADSNDARLQSAPEGTVWIQPLS